jgi:hypothetical protein
MSASPRRLAIKYTAAYLLFFFLPFSLLVDYAFHLFFSWLNRSRRPLASGFSSFGESVGTTLCVGVFSYIAFRNLFDPAYQRTSSVDRMSYLTLKLPYHVAFDKCLDSLHVVGKPTILVESRARGVIDAAVPSSPIWKLVFQGYGARIRFQLGSDRRGETELKIASRSPLSTARFGSRHHERNVRRIAAFLQENPPWR